MSITTNTTSRRNLAELHAARADRRAASRAARSRPRRPLRQNRRALAASFTRALSDLLSEH